MFQRVIIVEKDSADIEKISTSLHDSKDFNIVATFDNVGAALGQSNVFRPDVFLIDVDSDENREMIPAFVDIFPKSLILGMLSKWDSKIAEKCTVFGAFGCILKSFNPEELKDSISLYQLRGKPEITRTFAVFSPKGRSGKTTFITMLALSLAKKSGESVAIIDADLQFGDVAIFFDVEPVHTVVEAARDVNLLSPISLSPYFLPITNNLKLLCSPTKPEYAELVDFDKLIDVIRMASSLYRYILLDLPAGMSDLTFNICEISDTTFILGMLNTGLEVNHIKKSLSIFKDLAAEGKNIHVIFSRVNPCTEQERIKLSMEIGRPVTLILPNDYSVVSEANRGQMLEELESTTTVYKKINEFADILIQNRQKELDLVK